VLIAGDRALLFPDTVCGVYGSSLMFLLHGNQGYEITIASHEQYQDIAESVMRVLSTFQWESTAP